MTVGDVPSTRFRHSSVLGKLIIIVIIQLNIFLNLYLFILASDGRIIVYGGTPNTDKLAILDVTKSPFQWIVPTNVTNYPVNLIDKNHWWHTSNLYKNYMIISFGNL